MSEPLFLMMTRVLEATVLAQNTHYRWSVGVTEERDNPTRGRGCEPTATSTADDVAAYGMTEAEEMRAGLEALTARLLQAEQALMETRERAAFMPRPKPLVDTRTIGKALAFSGAHQDWLEWAFQLSWLTWDKQTQVRDWSAAVGSDTRIWDHRAAVQRPSLRSFQPMMARFVWVLHTPQASCPGRGADTAIPGAVLEFFPDSYRKSHVEHSHLQHESHVDCR